MMMVVAMKKKVKNGDDDEDEEGNEEGDERDTMDRSRGVITAPQVQVRQLTQPTKNTKN